MQCRPGAERLHPHKVCFSIGGDPCDPRVPLGAFHFENNPFAPCYSRPGAKRLQPGKLSPPLEVPPHIPRPSYAESGIPPAFKEDELQIHDKKGIERMRAAGKLAAEVREYAGTLVKVSDTLFQSLLVPDLSLEGESWARLTADLLLQQRRLERRVATCRWFSWLFLFSTRSVKGAAAKLAAEGRVSAGTLLTVSVSFFALLPLIRLFPSLSLSSLSGGLSLI
jgi:hypothetical protein